MNKIILDIIKRKTSKLEKNKSLDDLKADIQIAEKILSGELKYCEDCNDYYLAESFICKKEVKNSKIITYSDPINSGGNEYRDGQIEYCYELCPKGHKHLISQIEL